MALAVSISYRCECACDIHMLQMSLSCDLIQTKGYIIGIHLQDVARNFEARTLYQYTMNFSQYTYVG